MQTGCVCLLHILSKNAKKKDEKKLQQSEKNARKQVAAFHFTHAQRRLSFAPKAFAKSASSMSGRVVCGGRERGATMRQVVSALPTIAAVSLFFTVVQRCQTTVLCGLAF